MNGHKSFYLNTVVETGYSLHHLCVGTDASERTDHGGQQEQLQRQAKGAHTHTHTQTLIQNDPSLHDTR